MCYVLDDREYGYDEKVSSKLDEYGRVLLHGKGYDRWFDKSFNLCFSTNGFVSYCFKYNYRVDPPWTTNRLIINADLTRLRDSKLDRIYFRTFDDLTADSTASRRRCT